MQLFTVLGPFLIASLAVGTTAVWSARLTATSVRSAWYDCIRPDEPWEPPRAVFPIVWSILYICLALALGISLTHSQRPHGCEWWPIILGLHAANLVLNVIWCHAFFVQKRLRRAWYILILTVACATTLTAMLLWRGAVAAGLLLVPYVAWISYAAFLNALSIRKQQQQQGACSRIRSR
jgi:translocator protein